jgi:phosphoribosylformimino-5-aminoimidazole carboxamide ribotide isomerase
MEIARLFEDAGIALIVHTDVERDGMMQGLNLEASIALAEAVSVPVVASGGLASLDDVRALIQPRAKMLAGAVAGRALYDGRLDAKAALALIKAATAA